MQYQGFGVFDQKQPSASYPGTVSGFPEPTGRPNNRAPLIVALSVATAAIALIVTMVVLISRNSGEPAAPVAAPSTSHRPKHSSEPPSSEPAATRPMSVPALTPGWSGLAWTKFGIAYDVPPGWEPSKPGSLTGFEHGGERVSLSAYSDYMRDFCPQQDTSFRAEAGVTSSAEPDTVKAANDTIQQWARLGWSVNGAPPQVTVNPAAPVDLDSGKLHGQLISATIIPAGPMPCGSPNVYVSLAALRSENGTAMVMGIADQGVPGAVSPSDVNRVVTSMRKLPK